MGMMTTQPQQAAQRYAYNGIVNVPNVGKVQVNNGIAQVEGKTYYVVQTEQGYVAVDSNKQPIGIIVNGQLQPLN